MIPILLCPFFVEISNNVPKSKHWSPYIICTIFSFTLGTLQSVQDRLYDPFVPPTIDSINVKEVNKINHKLINKQVAKWASESLVHTVNRAYRVGRFKVHSPKYEKITLDDYSPKKNIFKVLRNIRFNINLIQNKVKKSFKLRKSARIMENLDKTSHINVGKQTQRKNKSL